MESGEMVLVNDLKSFEDDFLFFQNSINSFRKKFKNSFIVIKDKEIISSDKDLNDALKKAEKKGIDVKKALVEFVADKETLMIL